jgi:hypothetical protein
MVIARRTALIVVACLSASACSGGDTVLSPEQASCLGQVDLVYETASEDTVRDALKDCVENRWSGAPGNKPAFLEFSPDLDPADAYCRAWAWEQNAHKIDPARIEAEAQPDYDECMATSRYETGSRYRTIAEDVYR